MSSLLHRLESDEAVLLLYMADELPAKDRAAVEQRLAAEPEFRVKLERLGATQHAVAGALAAADVKRPVKLDGAARRATRLVQEWAVQHQVKPAPEPEPDALRYPWWSYPLTAAAAIGVAVLVYWINSPVNLEMPAPGGAFVATEETPDEELLEPMESLTDLSSLEALSDAEQQLQTIELLRESMR